MANKSDYIKIKNLKESLKMVENVCNIHIQQNTQRVINLSVYKILKHWEKKKDKPK